MREIKNEGGLSPANSVVQKIGAKRCESKLLKEYRVKLYVKQWSAVGA